jgi:hypothetical protein
MGSILVSYNFSVQISVMFVVTYLVEMFRTEQVASLQRHIDDIETWSKFCRKGVEGSLQLH